MKNQEEKGEDGGTKFLVQKLLFRSSAVDANIDFSNEDGELEDEPLQRVLGFSFMYSSLYDLLSSTTLREFTLAGTRQLHSKPDGHKIKCQNT